MTIQDYNGVKIAIIESESILVKDLDDAIDLIGNCYYQGASGILMKKECLVPGFFDLKTGIAGDILQKFSNYNMALAIVGDFSGYNSKSLNDFIHECNLRGQINFVQSNREGIEKLSNRS